MRHRQNERVQVREALERLQLEAKFGRRFCRSHQGVMHQRGDAIVRQGRDDVRHAAVAEVRDVLLERQAEHADPGALDSDVGLR